MILKNGMLATIIYVTQRGMTALMLATDHGYMETVNVLLAAGADIYRQDNVSTD